MKMMAHRGAMIGALVGAGLGASTACGQEAPPASPRVVKPYPGVVVRADEKIVEIEAEVCLTEGWLEQIACSPNSREHESLVVIQTMPSEIHTSLLLAGFKSGRPGRWIYEDNEVRTEPPTGDAVDVFVRYEAVGEGQDSNPTTIEKPIRAWIRDHESHRAFPDTPWVFGGSSFKPKPDWMDEGKGEYYVADFTGSIIGLVTFGDEVLGFRNVISDKEDIAAPMWEVNTDAIPPEGTKVMIVIRPASEKAAKKPETP